jgi:hypothetical protein
MCETKLYKSQDCEHKWLVIDIPCGPAKGFRTCANFKGNKTKAALKPNLATKHNCPWHGLNGNYDMNRIRMIESMKHGFSLGGRPRGYTGNSTMICCGIQ